MGIVMEIPSIDQIDRYVARLEDRQLDWGVLDFQARVDPKYRRAQMRYVGGGGTGQHDDPNIIKAGHFTLSTMVLPPGHEGPLHLHTDVEELFFVLEGTLTGIWGGVRNDGDKDVAFLTMLGAQKPELPSYPEGSPLTEARSTK